MDMLTIHRMGGGNELIGRKWKYSLKFFLRVAGVVGGKPQTAEGRKGVPKAV